MSPLSIRHGVMSKHPRELSVLRVVLGVGFMATLIVPLFIAHVWTWLYQAISFPLLQIPKIYLKDYIVIDRGRLKQLSLTQKLGCIYCGYANGVTTWMKETANLTELYTCAIKHSLKRKGQEHQNEFYEYSKFA